MKRTRIFVTVGQDYSSAAETLALKNKAKKIKREIRKKENLHEEDASSGEFKITYYT